MTTTLSDSVKRLAACGLIRTRFAGRAKLEQQAAYDLVALKRLEVALGLADASELAQAIRDEATAQLLREARAHNPAAIGYLLAGDDYEARERFAAIRYAKDGYAGSLNAWGETKVDRIVAGPACDEIDRKRAARRDLRKVVDALAARPARWAESQIVERRAREVISAARLRTATHGHEDSFAVVEPGKEHAASTTETDWPDRLGVRVAKSYGYRVTVSVYRWSVSRAILSPATKALNDAAPHGVVYLSPCTRVRQGRGTSLVVETLTARGAWKAAS